MVVQGSEPCTGHDQALKTKPQMTPSAVLHNLPPRIWKPDALPTTGAALRALMNAPRKGPDVIVPEFIYRGKTTIFYGDPSIGKTTLALSMAVCLASGLPVYDQLATKPSRVYMMLFETEPEEIADSLTCIATRFPINEENLIIDTDTIGMDCANPVHAEQVINRVKTYRPDAIIIDPLFMLVAGGLSKDEPSSNVVRFLRKLCHDTNAGTMVLHHGKKEQFDRGTKVPGAYYGAIWIRAHCRIMWEVVEGPDKSRILNKKKDNLGVCRERITLHYDPQSCTSTMKEEGDHTAKTRLVNYLNSLQVGSTQSTVNIAEILGISVRTIKNLFNDETVLKLVDLDRTPGRPTVWKIRPRVSVVS